MNRELLAKVRDRIAEVGNEHCDMGTWSKGEPRGQGEVDCGTTACLAGWTTAVAFGVAPRQECAVADEAERLLSVSGNLFYKSLWPEHYKNLARDEGDAKGMLAVCDALLDGALVFDADGNLIEASEF